MSSQTKDWETRKVWLEDKIKFIEQNKKEIIENLNDDTKQKFIVKCDEQVNKYKQELEALEKARKEKEKLIEQQAKEEVEKMYLFSTLRSPRGNTRIPLNSDCATSCAETRSVLNKYEKRKKLLWTRRKQNIKESIENAKQSVKLEAQRTKRDFLHLIGAYKPPRELKEIEKKKEEEKKKEIEENRSHALELIRNAKQEQQTEKERKRQEAQERAKLERIRKQEEKRAKLEQIKKQKQEALEKSRKAREELIKQQAKENELKTKRLRWARRKQNIKESIENAKQSIKLEAKKTKLSFLHLIGLYKTPAEIRIKKKKALEESIKIKQQKLTELGSWRNEYKELARQLTTEGKLEKYMGTLFFDIAQACYTKNIDRIIELRTKIITLSEYQSQSEREKTLALLKKIILNKKKTKVK